METTCASYGQAMPYRPLVELYRRYFDLPEGLATEETKRRVRDQLDRLGLDGEESALFLHHFLGLPVPAEFLLQDAG